MRYSMKFITFFFLLVISLLSGEIIYRSKSYISQDALHPDLLDAQPRPKRTLMKIEKEIEQEEQEEKILYEEMEFPRPSLEEFYNVFYLDRKGKLFVHPKSVVDLRKVANISKDSQLYYGIEKDGLDIYEFPIQTFEGIESIYYSENKNETNPKELKIFIDSKNPEIVQIELFGEPYSKGERKIFPSGTELEVTATDADSGIKAIRILNKNGDILAKADVLFEQEKEYKARFSLTNSTQELIVEVEDNVSNSVRSESIQVEIDATPPQITLNIEPQLSELQEANGLCPMFTTISALAEDKETEVSLIEYRYPNGKWKPYKSKLVLAKAGTYRIEFRAKDYFGNTSLPVYVECRVVEEAN